VKYLQGKFN